MSLEELRKKVDEIDKQIIQLLNQRTTVALDIGTFKQKKGEEIYSPAREAKVYSKIDRENQGPLPSDALKSIYREIMSAALSLEKQLKIAYLGPEASFTNLAALSKFGNSVEYVACDNIGDVFIEVDKGTADYGVIPIENSTEGAVSHSLDMFIDSDLKICNEIFFEVNHYVMSNSNLPAVRRVYSNPQVFGQCRGWLKMHLPKAELIDTASTTAAARRAAGEEGAAAIASRLASVLYNINIVAECVEDLPHNVTRFLIVGRKLAEKTGSDKTSIVCSIKDKVGALYDMLKPISKQKLNMTKIESRPSKKKAWDYYFFIDLEGHIEDEKVKEVIREMEDHVRMLKVLGSYPMQK
ncbi:MAG: prephenate dehydratase [Candidatus Omnitrophica bacterium]|nr:prephenate dehydratase [Candidatus Omnitrophota bacterium]